ncbi:MAG: hypothetical protein ACOY99_12040 [Pseudomonadota bacterium]
MARSCSTTLIAILLGLAAFPSAAQQAAAPETVARLTSTAVAAMPRGGLIMIDAFCGDPEGEAVARQVADWLQENGFTVAARAPLVLRIEVSPCEDDDALRSRGALRDAYEGSSAAKEHSRALPLLKIPLGKSRDGDFRVAVKFLLFEPGKKPLWNAVIIGQDATRDPGQYKTRLADVALAAFGSTVERDVTGEEMDG